jgi:hypothetical protein
MKRAKYLILGALVATPAVVVLAVQKAGTQRSSADVHRSQWEYRVVHEHDLVSAIDSSATLANYAEAAVPSAPQQKEAKLNEMGTQGWALVAVEDHCMIFRRGRN